MGREIAQDSQEILDKLADGWRSSDIRQLGASLLRLADSLDQNWDGNNVHGQSIFRWPNRLSRIEVNAVNLATKAQLIYSRRMKRRKYVPPQLLGEPAWDMLLELFMQYAGGAKVSTTSLCHASHAPLTTALRYIAELEEVGLVERSSSSSDKRVTFVQLTDNGIIAVGSYLEQY